MPSVGPPPATGSRPSWPRSSRSRSGPRRPMPTCSTIGWSSASRFPSSAPGLSSSASGSRSWPPPTTPAATSPPTAASPRTPPGSGGWCPPSGPTASSIRRSRVGPARLDELGRAAGVDTRRYPGYLEALEDRRRYFREHGATATDHGPPDPVTVMLSHEHAERLFAQALLGRATPDELQAFRGHMLCEMARMSCDDGLVMQLHPGVLRNHHPPDPARLRNRPGSRHPRRGRIHPLPASPARALWGPPQLPDRPLHPG